MYQIYSRVRKSETTSENAYFVQFIFKFFFLLLIFLFNLSCGIFYFKILIIWKLFLFNWSLYNDIIRICCQKLGLGFSAVFDVALTSC